MRKIYGMIFLLLVAASFFQATPHALAHSFQDCILPQELLGMPGKTVLESVSIELPEFTGHFERVATRIKKQTDQFDVTLLVFKRNGVLEPLFEKIVTHNQEEFLFVFHSSTTCRDAYSNNVDIQFIYDFISPSDKENTISRIIGMRFFLEGKSEGQKKEDVVRTFFLDSPVLLPGMPVPDINIVPRSHPAFYKER